MQNLSIYIHYPFCKAKCPYCDFNSHVRQNIEHERFEHAYLKELEYFAPQTKNRKITTIFFGGGTPSLMPTNLVAKIIEKISQLWQIDKNCEITLEANPTSFEAAKFHDFKKAGINRLSIGIQALNDEDLKFLGREHSAIEAINTIISAQKIFENYSFDLIYARPKQDLASWEKELTQALNLAANHLSLYQLTIEKGTKFFTQHKKGEFLMPNEELAAQFYELTNEITAQNGLELYEISNYAKKGFECKHNLAYWQSQDYLGIGAGAHGRAYLDIAHGRAYFPLSLRYSATNEHYSPSHNEINNETGRFATIMLHEPTKWLEKVEESGAAIQNMTAIENLELAEEIVLMALRLKSGLTNEILAQHPIFQGKKINEIFNLQKLDFLFKQDFLRLTENSLFIPQEKMLLANQIILKTAENIVLDSNHFNQTRQTKF